MRANSSICRCATSCLAAGEPERVKQPWKLTIPGFKPVPAWAHNLASTGSNLPVFDSTSSTPTNSRPTSNNIPMPPSRNSSKSLASTVGPLHHPTVRFESSVTFERLGLPNHCRTGLVWLLVAIVPYLPPFKNQQRAEYVGRLYIPSAESRPSFSVG